MFYITSKGALYVRNNGDYMVKMLELAGGRYAPEGLGTGESGTRQMEMEAFYLVAGDADCILYIGQLGGKPKTLSQLIERNTLLADFKAVQNGRVYCTRRRLFSAGRTAGRPHRGHEPHAFGRRRGADPYHEAGVRNG